MKKLLIVVLSSIMAITGYQIIDNLDDSVVSFKQNTLAAATAPKLGLSTRPSITIGPIEVEPLPNDTVFIKVRDTITVTNTKYVRIPVPKHTTDTVFMPAPEWQDVTTDSVKNKSLGNGEDIDVTLTIDGKTVYSSKATTDEP